MPDAPTLDQRFSWLLASAERVGRMKVLQALVRAISEGADLHDTVRAMSEFELLMLESRKRRP